MAYSQACVEWFREFADKSALIDRFDELSKAEKDALRAQMQKAMADNPGQAGRIASELIVNSYISGPGAVAVNAISGLSQMIVQPLLRTIEGLTPGSAKKAGEGYAMLKGILTGFNEAMAFAKAGFVSGRPLDIQISPKSFGMSEAEFNKFIKDNFISEERAEMLKSQLYDYSEKAISGPVLFEALGKKVTPGSFVRLPTKAAIFIDEFNKAIFRRMEFNAVAYRQADVIAKRTGQDVNEVYNKITDKRLSVDNWQETIQNNLGGNDLWSIQNFAKESVFQEKLTGLAATVAKARAEHPWSVLVIPFVKTPYNIIKEGVSYIPGVGINPFMKKEIGNTGKFEWVMNNPEQRGKAIAKQVLGLGAALTVNQLYEAGLITGSDPKDGRPPFSMKIGDNWVSYQRIEPLATVFGMGADTHKIVQDYRKDINPDKKASDYLAAYAKSVQANVLEKSFMEGLSKALFAMTDPERYGSGFLSQYANALVPTAVATVARISDGVEREAQTFIERAQSRIPGLREQLPIRYSRTGEPEEQSVSGALLGIKVVTPTSIEKALSDIGQELPGVRKTVGKVELNTEQYARYKQLAGTYLADGMKQVLEDPRFKPMDEYMKKHIVSQVASKTAHAASMQLIGELYQQDPEYARKFYNEYVMSKGLQGQVEMKQ